MDGNNKKTITLFADSLALPRGKTWGDTPHTSTYPYLLEQSLRRLNNYNDFIFINRSERFRTILKTEKELEDFVLMPRSDIVIIHCGIVDCAPRVFSQTQRLWIEKLPALGRKIILKAIKAIRHVIIKHSPSKKYVPEDKFEKCFSKILQKTEEKNIKTIVLNIIEPDDDLEIKSPGFKMSAKKYNNIVNNLSLHHKFSLIDLNKFIHTHGGHENLTTDGMHINEKGHEYVHKELLTIISQL